MSKNPQRPAAPPLIVHRGRHAWRWGGGGGGRGLEARTPHTTKPTRARPEARAGEAGRRTGFWKPICCPQGSREEENEPGSLTWYCTLLTLSVVWPFQKEEVNEGRRGAFESFLGLGFRHLICLASWRLRIKLYMKYLSALYQSPLSEWLLRHGTDE